MKTTFTALIDRGSLLINDGYRTKQSEFGPTGIPILRVADIGDGVLQPKSTDRIRTEYLPAIGPKLSQLGDVILSTKGTVGRRAIVPKSGTGFAYSPQLCFFRVLDDTIDARWLYYWLGGVDFRSQALEVSSQTDMAPYISLRDLRAIEVCLPPLAEQQEVSAILGTLDDKIESNTTMSQALQSLSATLFKKWRSDTPCLRRSNFGKLATVHGGATPRTKESTYWNGNLVWVTPTDITALEQPYLFDSARKITELGLKSTSAIMHPPGTILMTSRATIGAFAVNQIPAATNQGFIAVRPRRPQELWFLFEEMRARVPEFLDNANGSTFLELSRGRFKELPIDLPSETAIDALHEHLAPLHARAIQLATENAQLRTLRDTLLPELLSGRIRVGEAAGLSLS